ncbi:uncharacterized protein LOC133532624 [Cydia pomonella]|uniref:uncharacterized protein LOC133532624 n=1 Tax=Cydia pomonella TaxID=82600 RepID=UPI002ADE28E8|nr:uncharacterized protein LOC133532624 [Cydia pomonella]
MLTLTCTSLLLQLISKSTPQTKSIYIETYWKTTYVTDHVPDYWNHGPIYVPGSPFGTKPDIFPAWLPKKETSSTTETKPIEDTTETQVSVGETTPVTDMTIINTPPIQETTSPETDMTTIVTPPTRETTSPETDMTIITRPTEIRYPETDMTIITPRTEETRSPETYFTIIKTPSTQETTSPETDIVRTKMSKETAIDITTTHGKEPDSTLLESPTTARQSTVALETFYDENNKIEQTTESETPTTTIPSSTRAYLEVIEPVIRAIERESTTDPFSVFLRKMLIILSTKKNEDLPLLINEFREYVSMLLTGGQLDTLGVKANSYIATRLLILEKYPMQALHDLFDELQKKLADRKRTLPKEVNDILDYMDDTYDEAEEEAMQAVLRETYLYPNSKNNHKIAQGFVDYVFLKPLLRVAGTSRGNVLFEMITDALLKLAKPGDMFESNFRKSFKKTQKFRHESSSTDTEENISSKGNEESIDLSHISSNCVSESSETITSSDEENESSNERKTRKNYQIKNKLVKSKTVKKQNILNSRAISKEIKSYEVFNKLRSINRNQYGAINHGGRQNSHQHIILSTKTNDVNILKATEPSDIEMVLKSKIYDAFRRMDYMNYNTSTTLNIDSHLK